MTRCAPRRLFILTSAVASRGRSRSLPPQRFLRCSPLRFGDSWNELLARPATWNKCWENRPGERGRVSAAEFRLSLTTRLQQRGGRPTSQWRHVKRGGEVALKLSSWPQAVREMCLLDVRHKSFLLVERRPQLMCLALSRSPFFSQESALFLLLLPFCCFCSLATCGPARPPA